MLKAVTYVIHINTASKFTPRSIGQADKVCSHDPMMGYKQKDLTTLQIRMHVHNIHLQDPDVILQVLCFFFQGSLPILK
jgi:hypothetical protein